MKAELQNHSIETESSEALSIVFNGHVDHGKSTLVGRLLAETGVVLPSKIREVEAICKEKNMKFEYAFLLDAFEEEQDQGITIDVSQVRFRSKKRPYRIIDAPGHKEFLKNMISGASTADVAILLIDAEEGLREQSNRHATILSLLGIKTILVVINKMDLMNYDQAVYDRIKTEYSKHLASLRLVPYAFIPMSAYEGENLVKKSDKMPWYKGASFVETLDSLNPPKLSEDRPLRFPLQDVYKFDKKRIYAGRVESGVISAGDEVVFLPSGTKTKVTSIEKWHAPAQKRAVFGESIGISLEDPVFAERGEMVCHVRSAPTVGSSFIANIFWMGSEHLEKGAKYVLKITTEEVECIVESIVKVINSSTLEEISGSTRAVAKNEVAEIILRTKKPIAFDTFDQITTTGRFVLAARQQILGGGIILKQAESFSAI
jgi:sulfate adenylyltransferase large subunit